jgi:hypothetical protein
MTLTPEQHRIYFESRLNGQPIAATGRDISVRCTFHDDRQASMSPHVDRGVWNCHAGCGSGGVLEFEKRFSSCDATTAWANVGNICGVKNQNLPQQRPGATYAYVDKDSTSLFEKLRFPSKTFIQRGANGFICVPPKVGKSWLAVDLALSLAMGLPWAGFDVRRPAKVALVSREDNPGLTRWRMDRLLTGKNRTMADLEGRLDVNSREQSPSFGLDESELFIPMIAELKAVQPEFVILDVFNTLHGADENDNTEMRRVLEELNRMQREVGCAICVIHHFNKTAEGSLTQRLRGAGAIAGWAEWPIGVEAADEHIRKLQFELKAAQPPEPFCYRISGEDFDNWKRIERTDWVPEGSGKRNRAEDFSQ